MAVPPERGALGITIGIAGFLIGVLLFLALTGCAAAGAGAGAAASTSQTSSVRQQAQAVWLDYARCVRAHGAPTFPDPQVDSQGKANFGSSARIKSEATQAQGSCGSILSRLPAGAQGRAPVTAAELHQEVLFAQCMRAHGLAQWPDPKPDGTFPLSGTPYATGGKTGPVLAGLQACRQYNTGGSVKGS
jgi:hypothetical protein